MSSGITRWIAGALIVGIVFGVACAYTLTPEDAKRVADVLEILTEIFLRLIRMVIAPLVLTTLISGIANMGTCGAIGRVGARAIGWFIGASLVSLSLGLAMVNLLKPGI